MEINAKAKLTELSNTMFALLIEKGLLEKHFVNDEMNESTYQLAILSDHRVVN